MEKSRKWGFEFIAVAGILVLNYESIDLKFAIAVVRNISALQPLVGLSHAAFSPAIFPFPPVLFGRALFDACTALQVALLVPFPFLNQLRLFP
jgi:hypothetical protein